VVIAGVTFGVLAVIIIIVSLSKRRSSLPSSRFIDEERRSQNRSFTPLASQELSKDSGNYVCTEYKGGFIIHRFHNTLCFIHDFT
jgi:interleukin-1 receptor-associated kinase 1